LQAVVAEVGTETQLSEEGSMMQPGHG